MTEILDGKKLSLEIKEILKERVEKCINPPNIKYICNQNRPPCLYIIQVGKNDVSDIYVRHKTKMCEEIGCTYQIHNFSENAEEIDIVDAIERANSNNFIDGIMIQLPLPRTLNKDCILETISPVKDVDGMGIHNIGSLALRNPETRPATPFGIMCLLEHYNVFHEGKHVVIVGASNIVGRPMALEMLLAGATVTVCHRFTENLKSHVEMADILISAMGKRGIIESEWIKEKSVVVDVGINKDENGKICGDIDFESAKLRASFITPVPGGVGPMTVVSLMKNLVGIYEQNTGYGMIFDE